MLPFALEVALFTNDQDYGLILLELELQAHYFINFSCLIINHII